MEILQPDKYYHIYNRAVGNEKLFCSKDNYHFFLKKYNHYISPIAQTYAYCLMPNHFHVLISMRNEEVLQLYFKQKYRNTPTLQEFETFRKFFLAKQQFLISKVFSNLFSSYAQAFNKQQKRTGTLFSQNFKRKEITTEEYLIRLIQYIHYNPIDQGLVERIEDWSYSSYNSILSNKPTVLMRDEVVEWFGDRDNFIFCHSTFQV